MGIKMMVEILDHWQDAGLTVGERSDLLVLAENANDGTRLTFGPVHAEYILRRAGKTAAGWKNAIGKLAAKKVLTVHTPGRIKQAAVYRLEPLCPEVRHDGHKGQCLRGERVTSEVTHSGKEGHLGGDPMGNPTGDPLGQEGHLPDAERVTSQVTPTPPDPSLKNSSTTPSSSVAEVSEGPATTGPSGEDDGGGGGVSPSRDLAIEIAAALTAGQPVHKQLQETLTSRLAAALDAGWTVDGLAVYLHMGEGFTGSVAAVASWRLDPQRLPPAEPLPAPVRAAGGIRGPLPSAEDYAAMTVDSVFGTGRDTADGGMWERAMARANQRMGGGPRPGTDTTVAGWGDVARQLRTEHKPYSNDTWSQPADPAEAAKIPHCGHWECDPDTRLRPGPTPQDKPDPCSVCHPAFRF